MLNVITLFSGYDSQCLALDRLKRHNPQFDYDLVAWAEIDPHAIKAHNALFPQWQDRNLGDVSKVDWQDKAADFGCKINLLTYSSPCQDFSSAGLQKGGQQGSGTRSSLLWECERAIEQLRPKYLLFENVSALVSEKFRPTFFKWCLTLEKLGYTNHYQLMNAKDYGVPQNRLRIFMVSILGDHEPYYFQKPFPLEKRLKDVLETNVPDRYYLSQERLAGLKLSNEKEKEAGRGFEFAPKGTDSVIDNAVSTKAGGRKTDNFIAQPLQADAPKIDIVADLQPDNRRKSVVIRQQNQVVGSDGIAPAVTAKHKQHEYTIATPCILANPHGYYEGGEYPETSPAVRSSAYQANTAVCEPIIAAMRGRDKDNPNDRGKSTDNYAQRLEPSADQSTSNTLTSVAKDNMIVEPAIEQVGQLVPDSKFANPHRGRIDSPAGVAPTVDTAQGGNLVAKITVPIEPTRQDLIQYHLTDDGNLRANIDDGKKTGVSELQITNPNNPAPTLTGANHAKVLQSIEELVEQAKTAHPSRGIIMIKNTPCWVRRLTERELFRLMDVDEPEIDTLLNAGISNTQLAKLAGNSIVTACMYHIFRNLFVTTDPTPGTQTTLF